MHNKRDAVIIILLQLFVQKPGFNKTKNNRNASLTLKKQINKDSVSFDYI